MSKQQVPVCCRFRVWVPAAIAVLGIGLLLAGVLGLYLSGDEEPAAVESTTTTAVLSNTTEAPTTT